MEIKNLKEHLCCSNYEKDPHATIELIELRSAETINLKSETHQILFVLNGRDNYLLLENNKMDIKSNEMFFIPKLTDYVFHSQSTSNLVVFRITSPLKLCANYSLEELYEEEFVKHQDSQVSPEQGIGKLLICNKLTRYLEQIQISIEDGLRCKMWFELKVKEFFSLLRVYYTKKQIYSFLYQIISKDIVFTEYIRVHWKEFKSAQAMGEAMNMSFKQLSTRFKRIYQMTPHQWLQKQRAEFITQEITQTSKPIKQIALENGFSTDPMFTVFCKRQIGYTPTEIRNNKLSEGVK